MKQYLELGQRILDEGVWKKNRTGVDTIGIQGAMMQFDMADGFPAMTTKKLAYRSCFAEMLGFLRGYDNAADFRRLGTNVWNENANKNKDWLKNPNRKGEDDLGRIYGVQARRWNTFEVEEENSDTGEPVLWSRGGGIDQLEQVVGSLSKGIDNRRLIVTHWNPAEMTLMSLPPCHLLYQFGLHDGRLNLGMYQRSCDFPLGVPFNIAGYAWLLHSIARITGHKPGVLTHFLWDVHIYRNQVDLFKGQLGREPRKLPELWINPNISTMKDLEAKAVVDDFRLVGYECHEPINYPFSV